MDSAAFNVLISRGLGWGHVHCTVDDKQVFAGSTSSGPQSNNYITSGGQR